MTTAADIKALREDLDALAREFADFRIATAEQFDRLVVVLGGKREPLGPTPDELNDDDQQMYAALNAWRREKAESLGIPAYRLFSNRLLAEIARTKPTTLFGLSKMKGVGTDKAAKYGDIIEVLNERPW